MSSLERLAELLHDQGGLLAGLIRTPTTQEAAGPANGPAQLAAAGPRAQARPRDYELLIEAIYEGYLLHYETPRVVSCPEEDLRLLAGDELYALGLARLVAIGDLEAVADLADVIALSSLAQGAGEHALAEAIWEAGARAVGWGKSDLYERAKDLAFAGDPQAIAAMRTSVSGS
jgi:hypothetical protein